MQRSPGKDLGGPWPPPTAPVVQGAWAPPPAGGPAPPGRPWFTRPLVWVLALLGVLLIPVIGSVVMFLKTAVEDLQDVEATAAAYLDAVRDGDQARLGALSCESSRPALLGLLEDYQITDTHVEMVNGDTAATVTARVRVRDGGSQTIVLTLDERRGTWLVCGE
jgi:hypothetical protein